MIEIDKFICDICSEEFDTAGDLESHKDHHLHRGKARDDDERESRRDIGAAGLPTSPIP